MNKQEYQELRNGLYNEAEVLINKGEVEAANVKITEITDLDNKFDTEATAQANLNALRDNSRVSNLSNAGVTVQAVGTIGVIGEIEDEDLTNSIDYRKAFMNYVTKGTAIPGEYRNVVTKTSDVGEMIPSTVLAKIVEKLEATGMILPLVTRTAIKGGVTVPKSSLKPVATWVSEGTGSDKQNKTTGGTITFAYYKLRCAVANSLEVDTMALPVFEAKLIENVVEAMTKAIEQAILTGTGVGQPKGILTEIPEAGQIITVAKAGKIGYDTLTNAEGSLPLAYENGAVWLMTKKTFMQFVGMVDNNKQPIARVNYGINGQPERVLLGRRVICNDYMTSLDETGASEHIFAALFNMNDYVLNTNLNMTIKKYEDNETDDQVTKALMLADGKVIDKGSLVILKKLAA